MLTQSDLMILTNPVVLLFGFAAFVALLIFVLLLVDSKRMTKGGIPVVRIEPDDVIVAHVDEEHLTMHTAEQVRKTIGEKFKHKHQVLVMDKNSRLEFVRQAEAIREARVASGI